LTPDSIRLRELLARLVEADVRFVLVGGLAVNAWGYLRATRDVDFVPDPDPENLARLDAILKDLDVLQGLPQVPPFAALEETAKEVDLDGLVVRVCSLERGPGGEMTAAGATLSRLDSPCRAGLEAPAAPHDGNHHFGTPDRAG
jgi:predicted nucleotidyltransferase